MGSFGFRAQTSKPERQIAKREVLEQLASQTRDQLTELYTHAYLQDAIEREIARSQHQDSSFAVALIDIDRFADVNDARGHGVGNELLRRAAQVIQQACRVDDIPALFGGDELAIIRPEATRRPSYASPWAKRGTSNWKSSTSPGAGSPPFSSERSKTAPTKCAGRGAMRRDVG